MQFCMLCMPTKISTTSCAMHTVKTYGTQICRWDVNKARPACMAMRLHDHSYTGCPATTYGSQDKHACHHTLVDMNAFLKTCSSCLGSLGPFTASKIDQQHFRTEVCQIKLFLITRLACTYLTSGICAMSLPASSTVCIILTTSREISALLQCQ